MNPRNPITSDRWQPISRAELKKLYHCNHHDNSAPESDVLFEGPKMLEEALRYPDRLRAVYSLEPLEDLQLPAHVKSYTVTERDAKSFSNLERFPGVACRVTLSYSPPVGAGESAIFLHHLQDPGNAGTIIRTADWYAVPKVILSNSVSLYNHKLVQASMGSVLRVGAVKNQDPATLQDTHTIYISDLGGEPVEQVQLKHPWILCIGNESRGTAGLDLPQATRITIPRARNGVDSLNASISCAVILDRFRTS